MYTFESKTNTARPDADAKIAIRCPKVMRQMINDAATLRDVSPTEIVLSALEHEFARFMIYGEDFYEKWAPIITKHQQRRFSHAPVVPH